MKLFYEYLDELNEGKMQTYYASGTYAPGGEEEILGQVEAHSYEEARDAFKKMGYDLKGISIHCDEEDCNFDDFDDEYFTESSKENLNEDISMKLNDSLRKYVQKFLKANSKEIEYEVDNRGWEKFADDLFRQFSYMIDDYLEAITDYGKEDIEEVEVVEESKQIVTESEKIHQFSHKVFRTLDQKRKVIFKVIDHPGWEAEWVEHWFEELQPDAETWDDVTDDTILVLFDRLQDKIFTEIKYYGDDAEFSSYIYGLFGIKVYD